LSCGYQKVNLAVDSNPPTNFHARQSERWCALANRGATPADENILSARIEHEWDEAIAGRDGHGLQWKLQGAGVSSCSDTVSRQFVRVERWGVVVRVARRGNAPSGRAPFVAMMEAANLWNRHDLAISGRDRTRNGRVFGQRQVRAVIRTIAHHQPLQAGRRRISMRGGIYFFGAAEPDSRGRNLRTRFRPHRTRT
jgi:hypothetical protein